MVGSARADITFPVMIRGVIYTDNAPPVRVNCSSKEGNTVTFVDGDVSVSILPIFSFDPTCELHSAQGVFTDGERFNGEVIDEEIVVTTVTNKRGAESFQEAVVLERIGSGSGMIEMVLECMARFPVDKATQTLQPPLRSVQGKMMLMNDSTDEIFVGTWRTGKRK
jgi:hypothetical protein